MSWLYSRVLVEEYLEDICLDGAPCALWNGKHTQQASWLPAKTTKRFQLSQSGMTFKPLTADLGEGVLTSFLEAFPVKTSPVPAKAKASKENDHPCGNTWRESLEKFDLDTHTWKTHQCLWDEDLQPSSVILPKWGMMLDGVLWERTTLPRLTSGTGSGSWATPTTMDTLPPKSEKALLKEATEVRPGRSNPANLRDQVSNQKNWPTPTCQEVEHPDAELTDTGRRLSKDGKSSHSLNLADSVKQWPTPRCFMHKDAAYDRGKANLGEVVCGEEGATAEKPISGQLNPTWVEWLMGWPIGWTSMEAITDLDWRDWSVDPANELSCTSKWQTPSVEDAGRTGSKEAWAEWVEDKRTTQCRLRNQIWATEQTNTGSISRVATGIKHRVGRLKAIGNGQVPQVAAMAWRILTK